MRIHTTALSALCALSHVLPGRTLHASEAGVVDWYKPHLGLPLVASEATAPVFHHLAAGDDGLILMATQSNVLGALHPSNGSIAWRYLFDESDPIQLFKASGPTVATLSGPGGAYFRTFDAHSGALLTETRIHAPAAGRLFEPAHAGLDVHLDSDTGDAYVLTDAYTIARVDTKGEVVWSWSASDEGSLTLYNKIHLSPEAVYLIGLSKSTVSNTLTLTTLAPQTGEVIASSHVPSSILTGPIDTFIVLDATVFWLEKQNIQSLALTPQLTAKPATRRKSSMYRGLRKLGQEKDALVGVKEDGAAVVLSLAGGKVLELPETQLVPESGFSGLAASATSPDLLLFTWSRDEKTIFAKAASPKLAIGDQRHGVKNFDFPFDYNVQGTPAHVTFDYTETPLLLITTSLGALQLWDTGTLKWSRDESLADIKIIEFVELPEAQVALGGHADDEEEGFVGRLMRQIVDAKNFPAFVLHFVKRFATGSYTSVSDAAAPPRNSPSDSLTRDEFGFRQLVVVATSTGKLFALDSRDGAIVWSRTLGIGWAGQGKKIGASVHPLKMFTTKTVNEAKGNGVGQAEISLVAQVNANNGLSHTFVFRFDPLTGADVFEKSRADEVLQGVEIVEAPVLESFLLPGNNKTIVIVDQTLQVHLFPSTPEVTHDFAEIASSLYFTLRIGSSGSRRLAGHQILPVVQSNDNFMAYATWTASFAPGEDIQDIIPRSHRHAPIASLGKVLGDRRTLYKYLNPHLFVVLTETPTHGLSQLAASATCGIYVVEGVKGGIVYHARVPGDAGACNVKVELVENWLVYSYYDGASGVSPDGDKSHRIVSVELYEGQKPDDVTRSIEGTSYENGTMDFMIFEQSFIAPAGITALSATATKFGMTSKDIMFANERGQIQSLPRRALDPRRPKTKPTKEEVEEGLIPYEPLLPDDPRRIVSHNYIVAKTRNVVTSPAFLESTCLVFASGLDLFLTRVAPSGTFDVLNENFNKVQLVLTISGLVAAIAVTRPMVGRKRLREKWYDS